MAGDDHFSESSTPVDELIVRALQGAASEADERLLDAWRKASPANERYVRETERIWSLGGGLCPHRPDRPAAGPARAPTVHQLTWRAQASARQPEAGAVAPPSTRRTGWRRRVGLAAVVVLGLFGAGYALLRSVGDAAPGAATEFIAGTSETRTITLNDGSIVLLTPGSRLRVEDVAAGPVSNVWLDGRAYFAIPPRGPGRHFRVRTGAGDAVVLGTRFDLDARNDQMRLLVVEGEVELAARGQTLAVAANQIGRLDGSGGPMSERVDTSYVQRELRWMRDYLVFTETPLEQVARELTRYYGVRIDILDRSLADQTVHGWFANQELDDVLQVICRAVEARCEIDNDTDRVTLTSEGGRQP